MNAVVQALAITAGSAVAVFGCGGSGSSEPPIGGSLTVTGSVYDFQSQSKVSGTASITTTALLPSPKITVQGADFMLDGVPENSAFQILSTVAPTHRSTYSPAIEVTTDDVDGAKAYAVSEQFMSTLSMGFSITPTAGKGVLLLHLVDSAGNAKTNVSGSNLVLANTAGATGPKFLDANLNPAPGITSSSASGWVVFFEIPPGVVALGQAANATVTLNMASSPVGAATVTIANVTVADGAPPALPTNVSFSQQVFPIFTNRGCVACHSGNGIGRDLGNLTLDGSSNLVYKELTGTEDPRRVQIAAPESSLVLTMPSAENPPDGHPNVTFTGPQDPDYLKILVWIREGAKDN